MRTQIAKTGYFMQSIPCLLFDSYPLPLLRRFIVGAAIEKNFFDFFYSRLDSCFYSVFQIILFNYFDSIKIRHLILDFIFQTLRRFESHTSFARYLLVCDSRIRFWFSTRFYSYQFRLVSALPIMHFDSSTLYLFCLL